VAEQRAPLRRGQVRETATAGGRRSRELGLAVLDEGHDQVRPAIGVVGHPHVQPLGVPADAVDHQLGAVALEPDHARAQPVLDPRQRAVADVAADVGHVARLAGDLACASAARR
jgi:hypothetical protein